jgi:hypothetical protein
MENNGVLNKTKCLVIGSMERSRQKGLDIRNYVTEKLQPMGITVWNHYKNPIIGHDEGDDEIFTNLLKWRELGMYDEVAKYKYIRNDDLALVDKADFIIMHYNKDILSCGTFEEFFWANRAKKPIFVFSEQGIKALPIWMFWTIDYKYFYDSIDEVIQEVSMINDGTTPIDCRKWKLLQQEYR